MRAEDERSLVQLSRRVRLVGCATPHNLHPELSRLFAAWSSGELEEPRFEYVPVRAMGEIARELEAASPLCEGPFRELLLERLAELSLEAMACEAVGSARLWELARKRYPRRDRMDDEADKLCEGWIGAEDETGIQKERILSDNEQDPRSLLNAMRRAVGAERLAVRVLVSSKMAPLAATGEGVIYIAAGRWLTEEEAARTTVHEVLGHAAPAERASQSAWVICRLGSAFGADDQEGRAILMEERRGHLSRARKRELALRHTAARSVEAGADFVQTARLLLGHDANLNDALRIAARVHRGGGLAREATYLPAFLRVRAAIEEAPLLDGVLGGGRLSVAAGRILLRA